MLEPVAGVPTLWPIVILPGDPIASFLFHTQIVTWKGETRGLPAGSSPSLQQAAGRRQLGAEEGLKGSRPALPMKIHTVIWVLLSFEAGDLVPLFCGQAGIPGSREGEGILYKFSALIPEQRGRTLTLKYLYLLTPDISHSQKLAVHKLLFPESLKCKSNYS